MAEDAYSRLEARFRRILTLHDAAGMLHWDQSTMMPPGGAEARADQLAELAAVAHGLIADDETADLLDAAEADGGLESWPAANLHEMRRMRAHAAALDEDLVMALSRASSACEQVWREARPKADFARVLPSLETLLDLVRRSAEAKAEALGVGPYDALLDEYEPDGRSDDIEAVFADLESFLPDFLGQVLERQASRPEILQPRGPFAVEDQKALALRLMETLGFDFDHGRLDVSLHPFCGGVPDDVRITTRYDEGDFTKALMGVLHETGHALYERGLPADWRGRPVGAARGMSVHESQSLLIEMQACRSREFLTFAAPLIRDAFGASGPEWEVENLHRLYTRVERGFIRVDADEVTYPAHVIVRFRLEKALIERRMEARDIPAAWNEGMERLLGVVPPDDGLGCLQDIHWYDGLWGYFPTYTLGAMTAAQLFAHAAEAAPEIRPGVAKGDFSPLLSWLRVNVHEKASSLATRDLLAQATGRPLEAEPFKKHLRNRYLNGEWESF